MGEDSDITKVINEIAEEINSVLDNCKQEGYFQEVILLYSFIENLLKWLVFVKILWNKSSRELIENEVDKLWSYCKRLTFYNALNVALLIDLVDFDLYQRIDAIRKERNDVIHQLWIYDHRNDLLVLRKKLEDLARVADQLVGIFNGLTESIGVDEVCEMFLLTDEEVQWIKQR